MCVNGWRLKYTVLSSVKTGGIVVIDKDRSRFLRMCERLEVFESLVSSEFPDDKFRMVHLTLTYGKMDTWSIGDLSSYLNSLRGYLQDKLLGWFWVGGMQLPRGALHYHVIAVVPRGTNVPMPDKQGHWKHGMSERRSWKHVRYFMSYFEKKNEIESYPKNFRLYGVGFRDKEVREFYKKYMDVSRKKSSGQYRYLGSSVTYGYALNVIAKNAIIR